MYELPWDRAGHKQIGRKQTNKIQTYRAVLSWCGARCEVGSGAPLGPFTIAFRGGVPLGLLAAGPPQSGAQLHRPKDSTANVQNHTNEPAIGENVKLFHISMRLRCVEFCRSKKKKTYDFVMIWGWVLLLLTKIKTMKNHQNKAEINKG